MARTKKSRKSNTNQKRDSSKTSSKNADNEKNEDVMVIEKEDDSLEDHIVHKDSNKMEEEQSIEQPVEEGGGDPEKEKESEEEKEETPSKKKSKKRAISYPEEILKDEKYTLFLELYRDRENVDKLVAKAIKELKKQKNTICIQLFALIFYLSDMKIQSGLKLNSSITSLTVTDMLHASQDNHLLPFSTFSKRSKSTFSYSVPYRRVYSFWCGIGRNYFEYREEIAQRLIELLIELTTYNHHNLRFVSCACLFGLMQGLAEIEQESTDVTNHQKKKKKVYEQLTKQCQELQQHLYNQIICHRIRDTFAPIRVLVIVTLESFATMFPSLFNKDDYIKYIGLSLGDSDGTVRLEAIRSLIHIADEYWNDDVRDLLKRYKQRILFMSRDQQSLNIIAIIRLVDIMHEKKMISNEEDDLIYELAVDSDRSIANRAFEYLSTYSLHQPLSKKDKKSDIPEKSVIMLRVVRFLEKNAADENETNHVYFFVKNCAGNKNSLITDENKDILNVDEMVHLLNNQKVSYGLTTRQLSLLSVLLKATVQLFYDNHDDDIQSSSYNQYTSINEAIIPHLDSLLTIYKADPLIETQLIDMIDYLTLPSVETVHTIAGILFELFENERDPSRGNRILYIASHLSVQATDSQSVSIESFFKSTCEKTIDLWKSIYKENSTKFLVIENEEAYSQLEETSRSMCVIMNRMVNLLCFSNECSEFQEKGVFSDIEMLLLDIKNTQLYPVLIEIRYYCKRLKQLQLLYKYYELKNGQATTSEYQLDDVRADTQLLLDGIQNDMQYLIPYADSHKDSIHSILLEYEKCQCDLLVVSDDSLITESVTQNIGEIARVLLVGSHDHDLASDEESFSSVSQQKLTNEVLTPLYQVSLAHINTVWPSCLFYYLVNYGSLSYELCKELFKQSKEVNIKVAYHIILDSLQYAYSRYKLKKQIILDKEKSEQVGYEQFISISKKFASFLGIQLKYDSLVALFEMMKNAIQFVSSAGDPEMLEFFEGLIPFIPKLTREAKDLLVDELDKSVEHFREDVQEVLQKIVKEEEMNKEEIPKYASVFMLLRMSLKKEKEKKNTSNKQEKEENELKAIAPVSRKRGRSEKEDKKTKKPRVNSKK